MVLAASVLIWWFNSVWQDTAYIAFFSPTTHPEKIAVCFSSLGVHSCKDPASAWSWALANPNDGKYSWTSVYERGTVVHGIYICSEGLGYSWEPPGPSWMDFGPTFGSRTKSKN